MARHRVDDDRKRLTGRAGGEVGNDEVVYRHRERHDAARDDAGHDLGQDDPVQRLTGRRAEVERRLIGVLVELAQLGHDVEGDVGRAECHASQNERPKIGRQLKFDRVKPPSADWKA